MSTKLETDLLVIGGGINGAGIAANAASRGLSVILCEQGDLAAATSSWSSKLIHGGLRYLEHYEFRLVRESLQEREILLNRAPHLVQPIDFVLPHESHLRPKWMIRIGLFLYDHLARSTRLPKAKKLNLRTAIEGKTLKQHLVNGFRYADCKTDDSRLVVLNALEAQNRGAKILTQHQLQTAKRLEGRWQAEVYDKSLNQKLYVSAKALVNAAGPWVSEVLQQRLKQPETVTMKLVKGSHIVVKKFYPGNHAYLLQNKDGRVVFVIPFQKEYLLIGTTDVDYHGDLFQPVISRDELEYLCETVNNYFQPQISKQQVVWSYAGVRPLYSKNKSKLQDITRDYHLDLNTDNHSTPLLSLYGGKITTYRALAEESIDKLKPFFDNLQRDSTRTTPLPGGNFENSSPEGYKSQLKQQYSWLQSTLIDHYVDHYGTLTEKILGNAQSIADLGIEFADNVFQCEIDYLVQHEWALHIEDIIWRRTKYGLTLNQSQTEKLAQYLRDLSFSKSI